MNARRFQLGDQIASEKGLGLAKNARDCWTQQVLVRVGKWLLLCRNAQRSEKQDKKGPTDDRIQWTRHTVLTGPFLSSLSRKVPISLHGASIVRIEDDRITEWTDYYDGLKSRRTALAGHFTEWIEL